MNWNDWIPALFCIIVGATGWYYAFYSRAAERLVAIEDIKTNQLRVRLRRAGGVGMCLLALAFAVGYFGVDEQHATATFIAAWLSVLILLPIVLGIGLADLRLTHRLRSRHRKPPSQ